MLNRRNVGHQLKPITILEISCQSPVARSCCRRHIVHSSESKRRFMQVQLLVNVLQKDLIVGCGKLKFIIWKFILLSCHSKNNSTRTCKVIHEKVGVADCKQIAPSACYHCNIEKVCHETNMLRHHCDFETVLLGTVHLSCGYGLQSMMNTCSAGHAEGLHKGWPNALQH